MNVNFKVNWALAKCPTGLNKYVTFDNAERAFDVVVDKVLGEPGKIIACQQCQGFHVVRLIHAN